MISQFRLDWVSRNWYFMDLLNNLVFMCSEEMKFCRIIIKNSVSETVKLRTFVIDPTSGYLFLTKYNPKSNVGADLLRYSMDGQNPISLLTDKLFFPNDLTLDVAMKKIYFLDHYFDFIQQCDYDGTNRQFLQKMSTIKFQRISFFENNFYGIAFKNMTVNQVSKASMSQKVLFDELDVHPKMVRIFHQQIQPMAKNSTICSSKNKCEHLCVPMLEPMNGFVQKLVEKCLCREGFKLENGKCKLRESRQFLMYVEDSTKMLKTVDIDGSDQQILAPIMGLHSNIAFDVDLVGKVIYFSSYNPSYSHRNKSGTNVIEFQSFDGSSRGVLKGNFGEVQTIAYDWVGKNLYFTSQTPKLKIAAIKIKAEKNVPIIKTLISTNIIGPCSLALDPERGKFNEIINCCR